MRHLHEPPAAEEVLLETMFEVWRTANRFEGRSKVTTWVLSIAHNKAMDTRRRNSVLADHMDIDEAHAHLPHAEDGAYQNVLGTQMQVQLDAALAALPVEQRECVHLAFFEGLQLDEIAEIQGVPLNTVKTRIFHAKRKLRERLADDSPKDLS